MKDMTSSWAIYEHEKGLNKVKRKEKKRQITIYKIKKIIEEKNQSWILRMDQFKTINNVDKSKTICIPLNLDHIIATGDQIQLLCYDVNNELSKIRQDVSVGISKLKSKTCLWIQIPSK